jgi:hypothetical protein
MFAFAVCVLDFARITLMPEGGHVVYSPRVNRLMPSAISLVLQHVVATASESAFAGIQPVPQLTALARIAMAGRFKLVPVAA